MDLLLSRTEPAPLLETIPRWGKYLRECITGWVHNEDLTTKGDGDVDVDFDNCVFPTNDLYYCIREMGILDEMREEKLVVDKRLETLIKKSSKPEPTQPEAQTQSKVPTEEISEEKTDGDRLEITFSRKGEHWEVGLNETAIFRNWVGMPYIEHVLQRPKQHISCISLGKQKNKQTSSATEGGILDKKDISYSPSSTDEQFYEGRNLDDESYQAQKELVRDLKHDLEEAEEQEPRPTDIGIIEADYKKQIKILTAMYDKRGNPRDDSSAESKARKNVSRAIDRATMKIVEHLPEMDDILKHIKTGDDVIFSPPEGMNIKIR